MLNRFSTFWKATSAAPVTAEFVATKATQNRTANTSHTWSVAMARGSGANRLLVLIAGVEHGDATLTLTGATYNSVAGNLVGSIHDTETASNGCYMWAWFGSDLPNDTSNHDMVVTPSASTGLAAVIVEYDGIADQAAESVDTSSVDPADDMTVTSTLGAIVVHGIVGSTGGADSFAPDHGQNERADLNATNESVGLGFFDLIGVSAGTTTSGITNNDTRIAQVCASFAKAA